MIPLNALCIGKDAAGRCAWIARQSPLGFDAFGEEGRVAGRQEGRREGEKPVFWELRLQKFSQDGNSTGQASGYLGGLRASKLRMVQVS